VSSTFHYRRIFAESKSQTVLGQRKYDRTVTAHLDALDIIGPQFSGAHGIWLDDFDRRRLADRGGSVSTIRSATCVLARDWRICGQCWRPESMLASALTA
jgi:hypothetical protein